MEGQVRRLDVSEARRLPQVEENVRLKQIVAEQTLDCYVSAQMRTMGQVNEAMLLPG